MPLLMALLVVTSLSCSFKETVPATYQCNAEQPTCPEGMECRGDQCVPVGASVDLVSRPADGGSEGRATDGGDGRITGDLSETCTPQEILPCTTDLLGLCAPGQRTCDGEGAWGPCEPLVQPTEEICDNNLDDDCDGAKDSQDPSCQACAPGGTLDGCTSEEPGICAPGEQTCVAMGDGTWDWGECIAKVQPGSQQEIKDQASCSNGLDDDCDTKVDGADEDCQDCTEGVTATCSTGKPGPCGPGHKTCQADGSWGICVQDVQEATEVCTGGVDEDCDTLVDSLDETCQRCEPYDSRWCDTLEQGVCSDGTEVCIRTDGVWDWGPCEQDRLSSAEVCTGGLDEDCDGEVDGADVDCQSCTPGTDRACDTGLLGVCAGGREQCAQQGNGVYDWSGNCVQETASSAEVCTSQLDEDCDGEVSAADSDCWICGDGVVMGDEDCDGTDFGESDCTTGGFDQGILGCRAANVANPCTIIYTGCYMCTAPTAPAGVTPDRIVDVATGDDSTPDGLCVAYKTITEALKGTSSGDVVWVAPGTYDTIAGEKFPVTVPAGVTLIGNEAARGVGTTIKGQGSLGTSTYGAGVVKLSNSSIISGFQISYDPAGPYANNNLKGILIPASTLPTRISNNRISSNSMGYGLYFYQNAATTEVLNNHFTTAYHGIYLFTASAANSPQPKLRDNYFYAQTSFAIYISNYNSNPDMGKDLSTDPGNNVFAAGQKAIWLNAAVTLYAIGNDWPVDPPRCYSSENPMNYEINVNQGSVIWSPGFSCLPY